MQGCEPPFSTCFRFSDAFFSCRGMARAPQNPPAQPRRDGAPLECRREGSRRALARPKKGPAALVGVPVGPACHDWWKGKRVEREGSAAEPGIFGEGKGRSSEDGVRGQRARESKKTTAICRKISRLVNGLLGKDSLCAILSWYSETYNIFRQCEFFSFFFFLYICFKFADFFHSFGSWDCCEENSKIKFLESIPGHFDQSNLSLYTRLFRNDVLL